MTSLFSPPANEPEKEAPLSTSVHGERPEVLKGLVLPRHVGIIMDGNGRWAKTRGQPRIFGHREGAKTVRLITEAAARWGLEVVTLYSFSTENWKRPEQEVADLMGLFRLYLRSEVKSMIKNGIRLRVIGNRKDLSPELQALIAEVEEKTNHCKKLVLQLAVSYGGRQDIVQATRALAEKVAAGELAPEGISAETIAQHLSTSGTTDPDLIIRTSGELRLSNFLLWESAYTELFFADVLWPDFDETQFAGALTAFSARDRRFGGR